MNLLSEWGLVHPRDHFDEIKRYENVVLFGCGGKGRWAVDILKEQGVKITAACDNNQALWGKEFVDGLHIQSFEETVQNLRSFCVMITCAPLSAAQIYGQIRALDDQIPVYHLCSPFKIQPGLLTEEEFNRRQAEILCGYEAMADEESRSIYRDTIHWKLTGDMLPLGKYPLGRAVYSLFDETLLHPGSDSTFVDVGAYTGDTIESYLLFTRGQFKKIIGVEADNGNFAALKQFVQYSRVENIEVYNLALWSSVEVKDFWTNSKNHDLHLGYSNLFQQVDKIANNRALEQMRGALERQKLRTSTLDLLLEGYEPTIMKINAVAADREIILGGAQTIRRYRPTLVLEFGVSKEDIFQMIPLIQSLNGGYRFYLRRKQVFGDIKTALYCIS